MSSVHSRDDRLLSTYQVLSTVLGAGMGCEEASCPGAAWVLVGEMSTQQSTQRAGYSAGWGEVLNEHEAGWGQSIVGGGKVGL